MVTAWDVPQNPLTDKTLDDSRLSNDIRWGFKLFTNTPAEAKPFTPSNMTCANCHLNAGQRERSLPLVGVAGMFPEYNRRSGRLYSLNDRIVDCFLGSENATGVPGAGGDGVVGGEGQRLPTPTSKEVLAIAAYITWLSRGSNDRKEPDMARPEHDCCQRARAGQQARSLKGRNDFHGALHFVPRRGRPGRGRRRQEARTAVGARLVE